MLFYGKGRGGAGGAALPVSREVIPGFGQVFPGSGALPGFGAIAKFALQWEFFTNCVFLVSVYPG